MLGDGKCDAPCYTSACAWDGLDCGCAPDCRTSEYGACKAQCLVANCNYDKMSGFPQCADESLRKAALYFHLSVGNFSIPFSYLDTCFGNTTACTSVKWSTSIKSCATECNVPACGLSLGFCAAATCTTQPRNCLNCGVGTGRGCLSCMPGFLQFYRACVASCPVHFHPHPLIPDLCFPDTDTSTAGLPFTFHVSNVSNPSGTGSIDNPFDSISLALAGCVFKYCRVELSPGQHNLTIVTPSVYLHTWTQYVELLPFVPTTNRLSLARSGCVGNCSNPVVRYDNLGSAQVTARGTVEISGVDWSGRSTMIEGCEDPFCYYCAAITVNATGAGVDDQGIVHAANTFAQSKNCARFKYFSVFFLSPNSSLSLLNSTVSDFRQGFASLFTMKAGYLTLTDVALINIALTSTTTQGGNNEQRSVSTAVIQQNSTNTGQNNALGTTSEVGAILLTRVNVKLLNNGFELATGVTQSGLISINGIRTVTLLNCSVTHSIVQGGTLISVMMFRTFAMDGCVFSEVYTETYLMKITPTGVFALLPQTNGRPDDYYQNHISITNTSFYSVTAAPRQSSQNSGVMLYITVSGLPVMVLLENLTFRGCFAGTSVLSFSRAGNTNVTDGEKYGSTLRYDTPSGRVTLFLPAIWLRVKKVSFRTTYAGTNLIQASKVSNMELSDLNFTNSGDCRGVANPNSQTVARLIGVSGGYLTKLLPASTVVACAVPISIQSVFNATVGNTVLRNSTCLKSAIDTGKNSNGGSIVGLGGLLVTQHSGPFSTSGFQVTDEYAPSIGGAAALHISSAGPVYLSGLRFENLLCGGTVYGALAVLPTNSSAVIVSNSVFSSVTAVVALLQFTGASCLVVVDSVLAGNSVGIASMVSFLPAINLTQANLTISGTNFTRNKGGDGAVLYVTNFLLSPVPILLTITSCGFANNTSAGEGVALYLDPKTALLPASQIRDSVFVQNSAGSSLISLYFTLGGLNIADSRFESNMVAVGALFEVAQQPWSAANPTFLSISSSSFIKNSGSSLIHANNPMGYELILSENNLFSMNFMACFDVHRVILMDSNSVYDRNINSALLVATNSEVNITASLFSNAQTDIGGAIYIGDTSNLRCNGCVFRNNSVTDYGGALFIEQSSTVTAVNCSFIGNSAGKRGAAAYVFGSAIRNSFIGGHFEENHSGDSGTVVAVSSWVTFQGVSFVANHALKTAGITAYFSTVSLTDCAFLSHFNLTSPLIYSALETDLSIRDCHFQGIETSSQGGAIYALSSILRVFNSTFSDIIAETGAVLWTVAGSEFHFTNVQIWRAHTRDPYGGVISSSTGFGSVASTLFQDFSSGGISASELTSLTLDSVTFRDGQGSTGGAVLCSICSFVSMHACVFENLTATTGAAVMLSSTARHASTQVMQISDCVFRNLTSEEGAVFLDSVSTEVTGSEFSQCSANTNGGALALHCAALPSGCRFLIESSLFHQNSAQLSGGSVYWTDSKPDILGCDFWDGSAVYGPDIASFPVRLLVAAVIGNASQTLDADAQAVLFNVASGQIAEHTVELWLIDHYGQKVATNEDATATLASDEDAADVVGTTTVKVESGRFRLKGFGITAKPGSVAHVRVTTSAVDMAKIATLKDARNYSNSIVLKAMMRACRMGESDFNDQCAICPSGKYSLNPDINCQDCPTSAICYGNYTMVPKSGYWRTRIDTDVFLKCPLERSCIGSPEPPAILSLTGDCDIGYFGNLCNGCASGFSRMNQAECGKCPSYTVNIVRTVGVATAILVFLVLVVATAIRSAYRSRSYFSIYIKILMNYLQLVMWTVSFDLSWPSFMLELFKVQQSAGNVTDQVFSIDCFFTQNGKDDQANAVRLKIVILSFLPVIMCLLGALFWLPYAAIARKCSYLKNELVTTSVVFFFLVHPSLVKFMFDFLNCRQLDPGQYWMNSYLNIRCWDDVHTRFAISVAVPSIIVWGVGLPSVCLVVLMKCRRGLEQTKMRLRLGFIYNGYDLRKYYWELIILYRKIIIISIAVFVANISIYVQALSAMLVILLAFALQSKHKPYIVPAMNELEIRAIFVGGVTIYSGMYCMSRSLDYTSEVVLFVLIIISNTYFLGYWTVKVASASWAILRKKCSTLAQFFGWAKYRVKPEEQTGHPRVSPSMQYLGLNVSRDVSDDHVRDISLSRVPAAPSNSVFDCDAKVVPSSGLPMDNSIESKPVQIAK